MISLPARVPGTNIAERRRMTNYPPYAYPPPLERDQGKAGPFTLGLRIRSLKQDEVSPHLVRAYIRPMAKSNEHRRKANRERDA